MSIIGLIDLNFPLIVRIDHFLLRSATYCHSSRERSLQMRVLLSTSEWQRWMVRFVLIQVSLCSRTVYFWTVKSVHYVETANIDLSIISTYCLNEWYKSITDVATFYFADTPIANNREDDFVESGDLAWDTTNQQPQSQKMERNIISTSPLPTANSQLYYLRCLHMFSGCCQANSNEWRWD